MSPGHCLCLSCKARNVFFVSVEHFGSNSGVVNILAANAKLLSYRGAFCFIMGELYSTGVGLTAAEHSATIMCYWLRSVLLFSSSRILNHLKMLFNQE